MLKKCVALSMNPLSKDPILEGCKMLAYDASKAYFHTHTSLTVNYRLFARGRFPFDATGKTKIVVLQSYNVVSTAQTSY